jgi:hypothetical protein
MPCVGFELMIPAFQPAKTVHALDRTVTVIVLESSIMLKFETGLQTIDNNVEINRVWRTIGHIVST